MKNFNIQSNLAKKLGKFTLVLSVLMTFVISSFNADAQCNIRADFKYSVDNLNVKFADNSKGDHKVLGWTFGDGNGVRNDAITKHSYKKSGTYNVCLIIYGKYDSINNRRCLDTICKRIVVKDPCDAIKAEYRYKVSENLGVFGAIKVRGARYSWSFGDGTASASGRYVRHKFAKPGTYTVCLTVKTKSCLKKICKKVTIKDPCDRIVEDFKFRVDGNVGYFAAAKYKGARYTWSFGDGSARKHGKLVRHKYAKPGTYTVCLQIKTKNCKKLICKKVTIKDPCDRLKADFAFRQDGNTFKFESKNSAAAYFLWEFGDGESSRDEHVKHTYKKPGVYKVCLTVWTKDKKCKFQVCKRVEIKDPCDRLKADFAFGQDGNSFKFESKSSEAAYFLWEFGDGESSRDEHVKHTYKKPGVYKVCLTVWTKDKKCKFQVCKRVEIKDPCDRLKAEIVYGQDGSTFKFGSKSSEAAYFFWEFGDGESSRDQYVKHTYKKPGVYKVCLTVWTKDKKCKLQVCKRVEIKDPCDRLKADFEYKADHNKATFKALEYKGATYTWIFGDGSGRDTGRVVDHKYAKAGKYKVCLQIKVGDCTKTICKEIEVKSCGTISIYPNPAHCLTRLTHNLDARNKLVITDSYGNVVYSDTNVAKSSILDVTNLRTGVYIVTITDVSGNVAMQRLIKK